MPFPAVATGDVTLGPAGGTIGNSGGRPVDICEGSSFIAPASGTLNFMRIQAHPTLGGTGAFRMAIYAATTATSWGSKLGETVPSSGLAAGTTSKLALLAPVPVVAGQRYALVIHIGAASTMRYATLSTTGGSFCRFTDTYSDGAAATAGALTVVSGSVNPAIWASTT